MTPHTPAAVSRRPLQEPVRFMLGVLSLVLVATTLVTLGGG